ncbi:putative ribonuclease H-like domain-containing protein, partial [Tanacetum coccineum]
MWDNATRFTKTNQSVPQAVLLRSGKVYIPTARTNQVPAARQEPVCTARPTQVPTGGLVQLPADRPNMHAPVSTGKQNRHHPVHSGRRNFSSVTFGMDRQLLLSPQQVVLGRHIEIQCTGYPRTMVNLHSDAVDEGIVDSGCSRSMTGNKERLDDFQAFKGGKMNRVLFTDFDCIVLSKDFKVPDESMMLLRVPRKHNMYYFNSNNLAPKDNLACLVAKASSDDAVKWHRRMGHVNYKNMNKLVKANLVRGLPPKLFKNDHTCLACFKGKHHKATYKAITTVSSIFKPLQLLHMDLFGPTSIRSIDHKYFCLAITDDYSRFRWVFFLETKDETYPILKDYISHVENQLNKKVKAIRCDNGTEFKNAKLIELYREKGIKRDYSNARTPQQNGVAERKNRTFIEAAKTIRNLNKYLEKNIITGLGHEWYFDLDYLTDTLGYKRDKANQSAGIQEASTNPAGTQDADSDSECDEQKSASTKIVPPGSIPVPTSSILVSVPTGGVPVPTGSPTDSFFDDEPTARFPRPSDHGNNEPSPGIFSSSSYDDEFGADLNNLASTVEQLAHERLNEIEAARLEALERERSEKEKAEIARQDAIYAKQLEQEVEMSASQRETRQAEVLSSIKHYSDADWIDIMAQVYANAGLSSKLLGADVNDDNFAEMMVALINQRKRAFAEQTDKEKRDRPMTPAQQREYMRVFVKNQTEFEKIRMVVADLKSNELRRTLKRAGEALEPDISKKQKSTEAPTPYVHDVPNHQVVSSSNLLASRRSLLAGSKDLSRVGSYIASAMYYTKADWINIMAQVEANASLSKTLLGDDVTEDNFPVRMAALIKRKKQALAEKFGKGMVWVPMTPGYNKEHYRRQFGKNQCSALYSTGMDLKLRTLKRTGPELEEPSSKQQKFTEAPILSVPDVPQPPVISSPLNLLAQGGNEDSEDEASILWSAFAGWEVLMDSEAGGKGSLVWNHQSHWQIQSWRLYTLSKVHVLETVSGE